MTDAYALAEARLFLNRAQREDWSIQSSDHDGMLRLHIRDAREQEAAFIVRRPDHDGWEAFAARGLDWDPVYANPPSRFRDTFRFHTLQQALQETLKHIAGEKSP